MGMRRGDTDSPTKCWLRTQLYSVSELRWSVMRMSGLTFRAVASCVCLSTFSRSAGAMTTTLYERRPRECRKASRYFVSGFVGKVTDSLKRSLIHDCGRECDCCHCVESGRVPATGVLIVVSGTPVYPDSDSRCESNRLHDELPPPRGPGARIGEVFGPGGKGVRDNGVFVRPGWIRVGRRSPGNMVKPNCVRGCHDGNDSMLPCETGWIEVQ